MDKNTLPFKISIASPCPARWEDMGGDHQVRFCDHCRKNVYNLSAMTSAEAAGLLRAKSGNLCARIYQRADGTVLTEDCPVGIARHWRRVKMFVAGGVAAILLALGNIAAFGRGNDDPHSASRPRGRFLTAVDDATNKVKGWAGLNKPPVALMGLCAPRFVPPPQPATGKVPPVHPTPAPPAKN
jgi:hypothetical protein